VTRRARLLAVIATVLCGGLGVISSTQTWLTVVLDDGAAHGLDVAGAAAIPVLAPLSLAVLALGAALSIVGTVLRYAFAALAVIIGVILAWASAQVAFGDPASAVASTVTESTGIAGASGIADMVAGITATAWPPITVAVWIVLIATGIFTLVTARRWSGTGRRYRTDDAAQATGPAGSRPHDAIDDWDDLSRGEDPTA
jgi:hypothetical protein